MKLLTSYCVSLNFVSDLNRVDHDAVQREPPESGENLYVLWRCLIRGKEKKVP